MASNRKGGRKEAATSGKAVIISSVFLMCFMVLLDIITWTSSHGGLMSFFAALSSTQERAASIEVDSAAFRAPIILVICLLSIPVAIRLKKINVSGRVAGLIIAAVVVGGGFVLDAIMDEMVVSRIMAAHGYTRCVAGDVMVGHGKGSVWFDDYVASNEPCITRRADVR